MKQSLLILVGMLALGTCGWSENAKPAEDLSAYLDKLQVKLEHTAQRSNQPNSSGSAVAGLRGSKQESASKQLYWKGKTATTPVTIDEVKLFRTAVEQAKAGQNDVASATLKTFLEKYPKSGLASDASDMQKMLAAAVPQPTASVPAKS